MLSDTHTKMYELLEEAKQVVVNTKYNDPDISNKKLMLSIAPYWEFLCEDEKKELVLHTIKVSATKV